jgi:hypothetical protein
MSAPQGLDLAIELRHTIHRIEHHDLSAQTLPAMRGRGPKLRIGLVEAQPAFQAELGRIASERLQMLAQHCKLRLCFVWRQNRHPAVTDAGCTLDHGVGRPAEPDRDRPLDRHRQHVDVDQRVELALERDQVLGPQAAHHLDLLGLPRAARLPFHAERLVLDVVPADAHAEA